MNNKQPAHADNLAAALNAAVDAEYPMPNSTHASVIQRATDNRAAMWRGINAARRLVGAASPADSAKDATDEMIEMLGQIDPFATEQQGQWFQRVCRARAMQQPLPVPSGAVVIWRADLVKAVSELIQLRAHRDLLRKERSRQDDVRTVFDEVERATRKFPTWPTDPLHAVAVLGEEFGELTKAVLQTTYEPHKVKVGELRTEAIQTAAMALRFVASLDRYEFTQCPQHEQPTAADPADTAK